MTILTRNRNNNAWQLWLKDEYETIELTCAGDYSFDELMDICFQNGWKAKVI